jgi:pilus assembly protein Flp/PilA
VSERLLRFVKDESGATAIEYAIIAGGISIVIVAAVTGLGTNLKTIFTTVKNGLAPAA